MIDVTSSSIESATKKESNVTFCLTSLLGNFKFVVKVIKLIWRFVVNQLIRLHSSDHTESIEQNLKGLIECFATSILLS